MELVRNLVFFLLSVWFLRYSRAQSPLPNSVFSNAGELDSFLQDCAYQALLRPRTGVVYDGIAPTNLSGIQISALRLRTGSLKTRGVSMYKEFQIPKGVIVQPYVERLVLVYQNLGNWSQTYYPLPGYSYLSPILGLLAYNALDITARNLSKLDIRSSSLPISINFSDLKSTTPNGLVPRCVSFDLDGAVNFSNVLSGNMCTTFQQGHFSIVVESIAPLPPPPPPTRYTSTEVHRGRDNNSKVWRIVGSVLGGLVLMLGLVVLWLWKYKKKKKMHQMERAAEVGEALHITNIGSARAPAATGTRTQPTIETGYIP